MNMNTRNDKIKREDFEIMMKVILDHMAKHNFTLQRMNEALDRLHLIYADKIID